MTSASATNVTLFGGAAPSGTLLEETWVLQTAPACPDIAPTWISVTHPPKTLWPEARRGHVAVYDSQRNEVVVFGGQGGLFGLLNDTWAFSVANRTWRRINATNPPCARTEAAGIYDPSGQRLVVFGGRNTEGPFRDTWALDLQTATWSLVFPNGPQCDVDCINCGSYPSARSNTTAIYDAQTSSMILHGGTNAGAVVLDDPWMLTLGATPSWSPLTVLGGSFPRSGHVAAYETSNGRVIYQGGRDAQGVTATAFIMTRVSGSTWQREDIVVGILPSAWEDHAGVWSGTDELWVLNCNNPPHQYGNLWALSLDQTPPAQITDVFSELHWCLDCCNDPSDPCWFPAQEVCWSQVGDDGLIGKVCWYEIRFSYIGPLNDYNFNGGGQGAPAIFNPPGQPGEQICTTVGGCVYATDFPHIWVAVRAYDERGNWSPVSNNVEGGSSSCPNNMIANLEPPEGAASEKGMEVRLGSQGPSRVEVFWRLGKEFEGRPFDLSVFDVSGRLVSKLAGGRAVAGVGKHTWDGGADGGIRGRGVFFVRLSCGSDRKTIPVVVARR